MKVTRGRERNAVLLIDIENLLGGGRDPQPLDIVQLVRAIREHYAELVSEFAISRAYANWSEPYLRDVRAALHVADIDPVQIFRFYGRVDNAADAEMIVDAISIAYERPELDVFVIATADGAFAPVATKLHELVRTAVGVSTPASEVSKYLLEVCDMFGQYDHATGQLSTMISKGPSQRAGRPSKPKSGQPDHLDRPDTAEALTAVLLAIVAEAANDPLACNREVHPPVLDLSRLTKYFMGRYGTGWKTLALQAGLTDDAGEAIRLTAVLQDHFGADAVNANTLMFLDDPGRFGASSTG